jgi:hypothetical protein
VTKFLQHNQFDGLLETLADWPGFFVGRTASKNSPQQRASMSRDRFS